MRRLRGPASLALLTAFGVVLGVVVLELGFRAFAVKEERRQGRLNRDLVRLKGPSQGAVVTLGQMILRSENPGLIYELRPRLDVIFAGSRVTTSDAGFRGSDVATPKPQSVFRIVGIGDSYMFGQGVSDEATYLAQISDLFPRLWPGRTVETVNLAVPGFNTSMEVELLTSRVESLNPDAIVIEIVGNDLDLPNFLWKALDPWTVRRLFLFEFVRDRLAPRRASGEQASGLTTAPRERGAGFDTFVRDAGHVPPKYSSMVGLPAFEKAIERLAALARKRHVPALALTHGVWFEDAMLKALAKNAIPVLILRPALRRRAFALGAPDYARSPLALSPTDLHPSALGHRLIAEELAKWLGAELRGK